ncbi:MAG: DUF4292 domain-containing protein [Bacteroidetes bacterium]|nr:DUF4292 domain-containing protein [Candidatus Colenecus caballi]
MRRIVSYILAIILLASCGSVNRTRKSDEGKVQNEEMMILSRLVEPEQPDELTASMSVSISGMKVNGQIRMRRDHSIQFSASLLGLMEVARIEFLPDQVIIVDRMNGRYCVCHYAFLPYRNELGLDFQVVQSIFWNRAFSPDATTTDRYSRFVIQNHDAESFIFKETQCGYVFTCDKSGRLVRTDKAGVCSISYSDFGKVSSDFSFPQTITLDIPASGFLKSISLKLSSVSTAKQKWPDRTQIPSRLKRVELEDILDDFDL